MNDSDRPLRIDLTPIPPGWPDIAALIALGAAAVPFSGMLAAYLTGRAWAGTVAQLITVTIVVAALVRFVRSEWSEPAKGGEALEHRPEEWSDTPGPSAKFRVGMVAYAAVLFAATFADVVVWLVRGTAYVVSHPQLGVGFVPSVTRPFVLLLVLAMNVELVRRKRWVTFTARVVMGVAAMIPIALIFAPLAGRWLDGRPHHALPATLIVGVAATGLLALAAKAWVWTLFFAFPRRMRQMHARMARASSSRPS
ncbi:MAG TPA: hypothetical protein VGM37_08675 [Armatimonadota bacterium]